MPGDPLSDYLLELYGGDPFASVREASDAHREEHNATLQAQGLECGVYPSGPVKMRALATMARAAGAERVLEIGCGLGYSALWLASALPDDGVIETVDRFPEHVAPAGRFAREAGLDGKVRVIAGEGSDVLRTLAGPYDMVHDDGWFATQPPYFERMVELLRPGGLLAMSNWFLLGDAITGQPAMDWSQFAGPSWAEDVQAYARALASHPQLSVAFIPDPWLAIAVKMP